MPVCGGDEFAARVAVSLGGGRLDLQRVIDSIWRLQEGREYVLVHSVSAAFGPTDIEVTLKTKTVLAGDGTHPTWRIAQFVEALRNLENVTHTQTEILIHDNNHDNRDAERVRKNQPAYDAWWSKNRAK